MKKAAIISLTIPEIPGKSGGEIRDIYMFEYIARNYITDYFSIHNFFGEGEIDSEFNSLFKHIYYPAMVNEQFHSMVDEAVNLTRFERLRYKLSLKGKYFPRQDMPAEILGFRNEFNRYIKKFFEKCAEQEKYDYVFICPQVNPAIVENIVVPEHTRIIWATYDVERVRHNRLLDTKVGKVNKWFYKFEIDAAYKYETKAVTKCDGIIAVSELDRKAFIKYYNLRNSKVLSIENGVDVDYFYPMESPMDLKIVFVGNMGYAPNEQATMYFVKDVFPRIVEKYPYAHFYAVGTNPSQELKNLETENVVITGRVDDVRDYLKLAHVVCVPLLAGSGTKYKVLEAMACEKAVVTTSIGAEGLEVTNGENILIADTSEDIANDIMKLFEDGDKCKELGKRARQFIMGNHAWNVVLPKINNWIERL